MLKKRVLLIKKNKKKKGEGKNFTKYRLLSETNDVKISLLLFAYLQLPIDEQSTSFFPKIHKSVKNCRSRRQINIFNEICCF